jgi:hypothetical protein
LVAIVSIATKYGILQHILCVALGGKFSSGVEVPAGSYTLVPTDEDEGARGDVHYVTVEQDPDQSLEVGVSACVDEGKPRFIH